jgi:hypothetical protein
MIAETPRELLLRGSALATGYRSDEPIGCEIFSLHGGQDRVINPPQIDQGEILDGAGHGMVVSHADEVSRFLRKVCGEVWLGGCPTIGGVARNRLGEGSFSQV